MLTRSSAYHTNRIDQREMERPTRRQSFLRGSKAFATLNPAYLRIDGCVLVLRRDRRRV
ncbi:MAG: hypothetical protein ABJF01_25805 [bacterium]